MESLGYIRQIEQLKTIGDPRRLVILQRLMAGPETLSSLGKLLGEHPAQVRHHLKQLEQADLIELVEMRPVRGFVEKFYQAKARAFSYHGIILPACQNAGQDPVVVLGSHDLGLEVLVRSLDSEHAAHDFLVIPTGSLDGLIALRQGSAHLAGCHLFDPQSGTYNLPYVRHIFPDNDMVLVTLAHREQGLMVAPGNPLGIRDLADLARQDVVFANRNKGSGTRVWLDQHLQEAGLPPEEIQGYASVMNTHTAVAASIAAGKTAVGIGLRAAARRFELDFIPLFHERYDLVIPKEHLEDSRLTPLLDHLQTSRLRRAIRALDGYDTRHTGEQIPNRPG